MRAGFRQCGCAFERDGTMAKACPPHEAEIEKRVKAARDKVMAKVRRSNPRKRYAMTGAVLTKNQFNRMIRKALGRKWTEDKTHEGGIVRYFWANANDCPSIIGWTFTKNGNVDYHKANETMSNPRPPIRSREYIKRASERPPRRKPSKRLMKRRKQNASRGARKVFPNPSGFVVRAQGRTGRPMYLTSKAGERPTISTDQAPRVFKTTHFALKVARALVKEFPMLSKYEVAVVDARSTRPN